MRPSSIIGVILIVAGPVLLIYSGVTYSSHKKTLNLGPIHASASTHRTAPVPPILGCILVVGGVIIFVAGKKIG